MKIDVTKVKLKEVSGKAMELDPNSENIFWKILANGLYCFVKDVSIVTIAQNVYKGCEVEMAVSQVKEMRKIAAMPDLGLHAFCRKAVCEYLDKALEAEEKKVAKAEKKKKAK